MTSHSPRPEFSVQTLDDSPATFEFSYDWRSETPLSTFVVEAVETVSDTSTLDSPPLFEVVDPDALDSVFGHLNDGSARGDGSLSFPFAGYEVTVHAHGTVRFRAIDADHGG